jgi:uncharacterized protein (DUF2236 family)
MTWRDRFRRRIVATTTGLFAHAPYPLDGTLRYSGDPGLFGPESVTWPVIGDVVTFIGGIRALLIQAAHQEVAAGVADHSRYHDDPLGRLSRTSAYVTATAFGARPEVDRAVAAVRRAHRPVHGMSARGVPYDADDPAQAAWVHNVLTDSFLEAYQVFGRERLDAMDADRFVAEQTAVGRLLGSDPLPDTAAALHAWIVEHPAVGESPGMRDEVAFVRSPPLPLKVKIPYRILYLAAAATIPETIRRVLGVRRVPGAIAVGRWLTGFLRWALGYSPSWYLALRRVDAPLPPGHRFRTEPFVAPGDGRVPEPG